MKTRTRIAASVVLMAGVALGTAGCGFTATQATSIAYDASDGVSGTVGELEFRNAILLSDDGDTANLLLSVVNLSDKAVQLNVQYEADGEKVTARETIAALTTVTLGSTDEPEIVLENIDSQPGALFPVFLQYGNETGVELLMPILDGSMDVYSSLVPVEPTPTATPTAAATPSATPTPTATTAP
ncbi:hypothetical protein D6T64_17985 [Cryobacterium melibiosiphilum]|uniref:DNA modification methylase n=1 Tax=Cryobacterium melibiosiphilum TaxID=995039 RepID=A0A3A5MB33_9MICO|nr:hypothetical protein [Cryobacterium melibiosiphilum]RJT86160.1 hypothetical protein D6T64_17985 [Cryobacterium melibiosiphilum]